MFGALIKGLPDAVLVTDPQGRITDLSERALTLFACGSVQEILGESICEQVGPESIEEARLCMDNIARCEDVKGRELRFLRKDGTGFVGEIYAALAGTESSRPGALICSIRDITDRISAEAKVRENEERFRSLFEGSLDAIVIADPDSGIIVDANPAASDMLMLPNEDIVGAHQWELHPAPMRENERRQFGEYIRDMAQVHPLERVLLRSDGKEVHVELLAQIIQLGGVPVLYSTFREITERKKIENELAKIERLESLGVLAGGIAHDFNNILSAIGTNLSMALMFGNLATDISKMLKDAEAATARARNLTQQLLTFSKGGAPVKRPIGVVRLLRETAEFTLSGSKASCEYNIAEDLPAVNADEGQISQVVQNLIINADQAMPEGGTIRIAAEAVRIPEGKVSPLKEGRYIKITVDDQGTGIPEKHLNRIFDPFFSTKYKGSGLGLSTAFSIIKNHGGHIDVQSTMGKGASFSVYLPASARPAKVEKEPDLIVPVAEGNVLLIDDDEMVRRASGRALNRLGYAVTLVEEGAKGVETYRTAMERQAPFDAVILDVTIPGGMGGRAAVVQLLQIDPEATVIVSSGYPDDPLMAHPGEFGFKGVIRKPYSLEALGRIVTDAIGERKRKGR